MAIFKQTKPTSTPPPGTSAPGVPPTPISDPLSMAAFSYACGLAQMMGDMSPSRDQLTAQALAQIARMGPRDAAEELLMSQMLMTHARQIFLNRIANKQISVEWSELFHTAADRAANTYRRQMETLAKYRQPRKTRRTSITTIRTAHINAKQILTTSAQTESSAVRPVGDRAQEKAEGDGSPPPKAAAADETTETLAKEQRSKNLPG